MSILYTAFCEVKNVVFCLFLFQFKLTVPKMGSVTDLCKALSKHTSVPPSKVGIDCVYLMILALNFSAWLFMVQI